MKKFLALFVLCSLFHLSYSQRFINGIGACVFSTSGSGFSSFVTGGITYSPRVNLTESDQSTISIGIPISIGISYSGNSSGASSASAVVNIPLVVNYNYGCGSTRQMKTGLVFLREVVLGTMPPRMQMRTAMATKGLPRLRHLVQW